MNRLRSAKGVADLWTILLVLLIVLVIILIARSI